MSEAAVPSTRGGNGQSIVRVDLNARGAWEITLSDERMRVTCPTLDAARHAAYECAAERRPCELIVRDAYHRVLYRELVNGAGGGAVSLQS